MVAWVAGGTARLLPPQLQTSDYTPARIIMPLV